MPSSKISSVLKKKMGKKPLFESELEWPDSKEERENREEGVIELVSIFYGFLLSLLTLYTLHHIPSEYSSVGAFYHLSVMHSSGRVLL